LFWNCEQFLHSIAPKYRPLTPTSLYLSVGSGEEAGMTLPAKHLYQALLERGFVAGKTLWFELCWGNTHDINSFLLSTVRGLPKILSSDRPKGE